MIWAILFCLVSLSLSAMFVWIISNALRSGVIWMKGVRMPRAERPVSYAVGLTCASVGLALMLGMTGVSLYLVFLLLVG